MTLVVPNDLPDHIVQSIKRHDSWYMAIVDQVFDTVLRYTTRPKAQSPFSPEMSRWLKDNQFGPQHTSIPL